MTEGNWPDDDLYNLEPMLDVPAGFLSWARAQRRPRTVEHRSPSTIRPTWTPDLRPLAAWERATREGQLLIHEARTALTPTG